MIKDDLLSITGLGRKRPPRVDPKYATFNRRMLAVSIDSLIILMTIAPLVDMVFNQWYGPVPVNWSQLQADMAATGNDAAATQLLVQTVVESGLLKRWIANALVQSVVLGIGTGICWHYWSATPGKLMLGLKIVDAKTEQPISTWQIWARFIGYFVSTIPLGIGFVWIGFDKRRQSWHDKMARTVVVVSSRLKPADAKPLNQSL